MGAFAQLCKHPLAVPNGLKETLRSFADAGAVRYELCQVLLGDGIATRLGAWARFTARYPGHICVCKKIADILRQADLSHPQSLGLSELVDLLDRSNAEPVDAVALGRLRSLTEDQSAWESDDLVNKLSKLRFRSEANGWVNARELLTPHGGGLDREDEETLRHALAPPECRLHPDYCMQADGEWPAIVFFQLCRQRMEAPAERLAPWILNAVSIDARFAAVRYLTEGDLGERVADEVRRKDPRWLDSVLRDPELDLRNGSEQLGVLSRRLLPESQLEVIVRSRGEKIPPGRESETDPYGSDSERTIARVLSMLNVTFQPQKEVGNMKADFCFTAPAGGTIIWEHLGKYKDTDYCDDWKGKLEKYKQLGFREGETLFTTRDLNAEALLSTALDIKKRLEVPATAPASPPRVLEAIYEWWHEDRERERTAYAKDVYPVGIFPSKLRESLSGNSAESDAGSRTLWFTMFALACFQSLGRTQNNQHRGFIERGMRDGWWRELAESRLPDDCQPWIERLEQWATPYRDDQDFLSWKRAFVDLYTVARWLDGYIRLIRQFPRIIEERGHVSLNGILRPTYAPEVAQLAEDAAPINRTLGIGSNWLIRELVRHDVYGPDDRSLLAPYCWMPSRRVRKLMTELGVQNLSEKANKEDSRTIHEFVARHLDEERARFGGDFDLPLQLVTRAGYGEVLQQCFERGGLHAPSFDDSDDDTGTDADGGSPE